MASLRTNQSTYLFCKVSSLPKLRGYPNILSLKISCSSNLSGYPNPDIYDSGEYLSISNTEEYPNISNSGVRHVTRRGCWVHICPCLPLALCTALRKPVYRSTLSHILLYYIFLWTLCKCRRPEKKLVECFVKYASIPPYYTGNKIELSNENENKWPNCVMEVKIL